MWEVLVFSSDSVRTRTSMSSYCFKNTSFYSQWAHIQFFCSSAVMGHFGIFQRCSTSRVHLAFEYTNLTVHASPATSTSHFPFKSLNLKMAPSETSLAREKQLHAILIYFVSLTVPLQLPALAAWEKRWWWHSTGILYSTLQVKCCCRGVMCSNHGGWLQLIAQTGVFKERGPTWCHRSMTKVSVMVRWICHQLLSGAVGQAKS